MRQPAGDDGKHTWRGYWQGLLKRPNKAWQKRARRELAKEPRLSAGSDLVRRWWSELDAGRRIGMNGPEQISWMDIDAWARRTNREPTPDEARTLVNMDRVMLNPGKRPDAKRRKR